MKRGTLEKGIDLQSEISIYTRELGLIKNLRDIPYLNFGDTEPTKRITIEGEGAISLRNDILDMIQTHIEVKLSKAENEFKQL